MRKKNRLNAMLGIAIALAGALLFTAQAKDSALSKRILGYYINWGMYAAHNQYGPTNIPWTKITHINYAFAEIVSGTWAIQGTDDWADIQCGPQQNGQIGQINTLKKQYGVKTLISVGGWTRSGNFSPMAATAAGRAAFSKSCAQYIKQYGFDGVDIDWEYPCFKRAADPNLAGDEACNGIPADSSNFTLMLQTLRATLDSAGKADGTTYYLSIAAPGGYDKIQGPVTFQQPDKYGQYVDWLNVMTYDFHGGWDSTTGHLAALYANPADPFPTSPVDIKEKYNGDAIIQYYASKGIPASKMNIGCAYYGRSWKNVSAGGTGGLFQPAIPRDFYETAWNYGVEAYYTFKLRETDSTSKFTCSYDNVAKAPYMYDPAAKLFYTYENDKSVSDKCDYMINRGLGGVFFWDFTGDYPVNGSTLTTVMYNKISGAAARPVNAVSWAVPSASFDAVASRDMITFTSRASTSLRVRMYDPTGRLWDSFVLEKEVTVRQEKVPAGLYFCKADDGGIRNVFIGQK